MSKPHLFKTAAAVLLALCLPVAQAAPDNSPDNGRQLAAGLAAYMKQDYRQALAVLRPLAEAGDVRAQALMAMMYGKGEGVAQEMAAPRGRTG